MDTSRPSGPGAGGPAWYFCLRHHAVEGSDGCPDRDRLGPYGSRDDAEHALEIVARRNEAWDNDPRWNDEVEPGPAAG